jgi:hypothetical protein
MTCHRPWPSLHAAWSRCGLPEAPAVRAQSYSRTGRFQRAGAWAILGRCDLRVWPRGGPHPPVQRITPPGCDGPRRPGVSRGNLCQFWRPSGSAQKVLKQGAKERLPIWPVYRPAERRACPPSAASNRRQTAPSSTVGGPSAAGGSYISQTL